MTKRERQVCLIFGLSIAMIGLAGCGNVYEDVDVGRWSEVGIAQAPELPEGDVDLEVKPLALGTGSRVAAGDMVHLRITVTSRYRNTPEPYTPDPIEIWLWTGRDPTPTDSHIWGGLGSARLSRVLVGRLVGEQIETSFPKSKNFDVANVPLYGFSYPGPGILVDDRHPDLTIVKVDSNVYRTAKLEILNSCPGKLYRRTAEISQWGPVMGWGGINVKTWRKGFIYWSAIEGKCTAPVGTVRFEVGPISGFPVDKQSDRLYNWSMTYRRAFPPEKVPHEYEPRPPVPRL